MKMLKKFTAALLAAAAALCGMPAAAVAAGEAPRIVLNASGIEGQYILRLEDFGSRFESVQFDILVEGDVAAPQVAWEDDSPAHFQQVTSRRENGKTVLTVYIDRLRPIANSGSVNLASLTFSKEIPTAAFSAGSELLALDEHQEETLFSTPAFTVTGTTGGGGGSSSEGSSSSPSDGGSSSSGAGEGGSSSGGANASSGRDSNSSDSSGSSYSSSEKTVLHWEDVSGEKTGEALGKKALFIRVLEGQVISAEIFRRAQQAGLWLRLDYGDYIWLFDTSKGLEIPAGRIFYDLSVKPVRFRNLSAAVEGSDLLQFEIAYSGALPCPATLFCQVGSDRAGETLHLSYYNESKATLDFRESAEVGENGLAAFAFTHASRYVVSERDFWEAPAQPSAGTTTTMAASPVIVAPEDEVKSAESAEPEPEIETESEPEEASSAPENPEDEEEKEEAPFAGDRRWDANIVPLVILFVSAAAAVILLLEMRANKKRRFRR